MNLASILVADADAASRSEIAGGLREHGHRVTETDTAGSALAAARQYRPDLMVCDFLLPDFTGVELMSFVRRDAQLETTRVLMTSARGDASDVVSALSSGADDYVGKPIDMREFLARVEACLRRPPIERKSLVVKAAGITLDDAGHRVAISGTPVSLTPQEYRLLLFLLTHQDRVFSREQLLANVWDRNAPVGLRTVDVHVRRLRSVMEPFAHDKYLQTVRGSGYRFSLNA